MEKLKIQWACNAGDGGYGNVLGYSTHNIMMKKYCEKYFEYDDNAPVAFHISPADHFKPVPGKKNILLTMWEFDELPLSYIRNLKFADSLVVPSSYCRDVFKKHYKKHIDVCWEGVESHMFPYRERKAPRNEEKYRILWLGAPNPRKGYHLVNQLISALEGQRKVEFYIKTTMKKTTWWYAIKYFARNWKKLCFEKGKLISPRNIFLKIPTPKLYNSLRVYGKNKNVFFDTRKLPAEQLKELYYSAHLFVFPSLGEGWGLPLSEAMATGCPCVASGFTGCADYFDDTVGYTLKHSTYKDTLDNYDGLIVDIRVPDTKDFVQKVIHALAEYDESKKRAKKASERIHSKFTWERSAFRLYEIIRRDYANQCAGR